MANNVAHIPPHLEALGVSEELFKKFAKFFNMYDINGHALAGARAIAVECHWDWVGVAPDSITFDVLAVRFPFEAMQQSAQIQPCTLTKASPTEALLFEFKDATQPCEGYHVYLDIRCKHLEWNEGNNSFSVAPYESGVILAPQPKF